MVDNQKLLQAKRLLTRMQKDIELNISSKAQLGKLLHRIDKSTDAFFRVGEELDSVHSNSATDTIAEIAHYGGAGLSVVEFLRIPFLYLFSYLSGEPIPFSINNNTRWLYAAILLGLTLGAILNPAVASILAFVSAGVVLGASLFLLGRSIYQRSQIKKALKERQGEIERIQHEIEQLLSQIESLQSRLDDGEDVCMEVEQLNDKKLSLERDLENEQLLEKQYHIALSRVSILPLLFRVFKVSLASLAVIGLVVSLFFPPVGVGLLFTAAVIGAAFILIRLASPLFRAFSERVAPVQQPEETDPFAVENELDIAAALAAEHSSDPANDEDESDDQRLDDQLLDDTPMVPHHEEGHHEGTPLDSASIFHHREMPHSAPAPEFNNKEYTKDKADKDEDEVAHPH